jgi:hypothetical protein
MELQEKMFSEIKAWSESGLTKQTFLKDKVQLIWWNMYETNTVITPRNFHSFSKITYI